MGAGIAQKCATEGFEVILVDVDQSSAERGKERIRVLLDEAIERKIFSGEEARAILDRIHPAGTLSKLDAVELVIEAVFEDLQIKRDLFARLDESLPPSTILATNTSSFRVGEVASATKRPDRVVGLHYFFHPAKNRLVEVVPGPRTSEATRARAWSFAEATGKTPIHSADSPGFVVNRFFVPWANEAVRILEEGNADIATIEEAAKKTFGIGMGPFELMNVTGMPIALHAATTLGDRLGAFYAPAERLAQQVAKGTPWVVAGSPDERLFEAVSRRLLGVTFWIAASAVEEKVCTIEDLDLGARIGLRWARGPFELANRIGVRDAAALAGEIASRWKLPLPKLLESRRTSGAPFEFHFVKLEIEGGIAEITFDRPDAMNALNEEVIAQLAHVFEEADARADVGTIVLRGRGKAFVAGADIKFFVKSLEKKDLAVIRNFTSRSQELFRRIDECGKLVICRLEGISLGGGSELALCCDLILSTEKGSLGFPETGIGIYPGLGGTQRTTRRIGVPLARWLVLTGTMIDAKRAASIGLVDEVVPAERMDERIRELHELHARGDSPPPREKKPGADLEELSRFFEEADVEALLSGKAATSSERVAREAGKVRFKAPIATRIADRLIREGATRELSEALEMELGHLEEIFRTADAFEGLSSLGRKRPVFQGR
jgi:enoyl-CoA hydratase/3-hydroxyacyl-CoA dehydrogenase